MGRFVFEAGVCAGWFLFGVLSARTADRAL